MTWIPTHSSTTTLTRAADVVKALCGVAGGGKSISHKSDTRVLYLEWSTVRLAFSLVTSRHTCTDFICRMGSSFS